MSAGNALPFAEALALSRRWYAVGLAGGARQAGTNAHNAADRRGSPWAAASEGLGLRDRARQNLPIAPAIGIDYTRGVATPLVTDRPLPED